MASKKRWVLVVDDTTHGWIKETARQLGTSGQSLFMEMLRQFKGSDMEKFKTHIEHTHIQEQLERIRARRAELDKQEEQLKKAKMQKV